MTNYRAHFRASPWRTTPGAILAVAVIAAETDAEAERLAAPMELNRLRRDRGEYWPLPSVEEALAYAYTDAERAAIARNRSRLFVGSPATVMAKLEPMIAESQADELMVITAVYDHEARKKSYSLLAEAFGLTKRAGLGSEFRAKSIGLTHFLPLPRLPRFAKRHHSRRLSRLFH